MNMHQKIKRHHPVMLAAVLLSVTLTAPTTHASPITVTGGSMTMNFDRLALASLNYGSTTPGLFDPSQYVAGVYDPGLYLEEFFDQSTAAGVPGNQRASYQVVPGFGEIDSTALQYGVNGATVTNLPGNNSKPTNFTYDPSDPAGTATGAVGFGGLMRFRGTWAAPNYSSSYFAFGEFTLEYDAQDAVNGASGWSLWNHVSFPARSFDLYNVTTVVGANSLILSGDFRFSVDTTNSFFSPDDLGKDMGNFTIQLTSVPLPAAVWLFGFGLTGLGAVSRICKRHDLQRG
jgi:hypothetical protein